MDYCLRNKPERLHESPVCGNGFVEPGEQCDCGLPEYCNNPCCNASACMLFANASCATGECCDLATCKPRRAGYKCRSADHECDLPEFCTGESEFCPNNVYKMDGEKCDKGKAFCYQGSCRTHSDQCRLLWGPSGVSSDSECYKMNTKGSQHGNCGYNRLNHSYIQCGDENVMCGMLHCKHLNERLEFGMESVAILSQTFLNTGGNVIPCRTAIVDLGLNEVDPGLAPDGATCGPGKMCVNQKCLAVDALQKAACPNNCHGRGICNSRGHCHCDVGYSPPYCADIGFADSGTTNFLIFLFAVLFMAIILLLAVFYTRYWRFKKKPAACNNVGLTGASSQYVAPGILAQCQLWLWLHVPSLVSRCGLKEPPPVAHNKPPAFPSNLGTCTSVGEKKCGAGGLNAIMIHPHLDTRKQQQMLLKSDDPSSMESKKSDRIPKFVHRVEEWFNKGAFKEVTRVVECDPGDIDTDTGHTTEIVMDFKPKKDGGRSVKSFGQASSRLITEVVAVSPVSSPELHRKIHTPPLPHKSLKLAIPAMSSSTISTSIPSTPGSPPTCNPKKLNIHPGAAPIFSAPCTPDYAPPMLTLSHRAHSQSPERSKSPSSVRKFQPRMPPPPPPPKPPNGTTAPPPKPPNEKDGRRAVDISSPLSPADSARTSLLTSTNEPVLNGIIGHHKGFTIKPLNPPLAASIDNSAKVTTAPATAFHSAAIPTRPAPARPTETTPLPVSVNTGNSSRPVISSPVLDATTLTAQQLISKAMPTAGAEPRDIRLPKQASEHPVDTKNLRQAPSPPAPAGYTPLAVSSPTKPRPLSSPTALAAPEPVPNVKVVREGTSTLSRIASIFHPSSKNNSGSKPKLDREALRSLEISKPIPQQEIEIPGAKEPFNRPVVMRAHSLRDQGPVTPRPSIPNFGSMRGRRPVSIPAARPTSPPPRPPPAKPATTTVEYDDCLNVQSSAPLANIDEEMPSPTDNIYAVIEECPPITSPVQGSKKLEYTSPTGEYQSPRPVENTVSAGSTESVGLLSEIVNEMQARNMESIYTSTLGRKRKKKEEEESRARKGDTGEGRKSNKETSPTSPKGTPLASRFPDRASSISTSNSSLGTYVNAPYTSNKPGTGVYTNVSSRNSPTPSQGSSQAGYLSPNHIATSPPIPSSMPVVTTSAPTATTHSAFSTFKGPSKLDSGRKDTHSPSLAPAPYKPFASTLQRPSGPLSGLRSTTPSKPEEKKNTDLSFVSKASDTSIPNHSLQNSKPPSSSVVKSVLAAVENSKKSEVNKPTSFRSADKKSPSETKPLDIEKKPLNQGIKTTTSMANRPLPEKPTNAQKSQIRTKPGPTTTTTGKPSATSAAEKPTSFKSKITAVPQSSVSNSKVPPTPPPPQNKPNKSSPDVVASCSKEQGNREPDVVSPAGNPSGAKLLLERQPSLESKSGNSGPRPRVAPAPVSRGVSHVASLQQKFETAASSKPAAGPTDTPKSTAVKSKNPPPVSARLLPASSSSTHK
ncbi:hypothetical protein B566_EDAN017753 [Ephemera danica]|nr:hypothetical protein B566_EDAN017753 [Ephemera danica]